MNQNELDALPDVTPGIGYMEREIDGHKVTVPFVQNDPGALFQAPDDGVILDMNGQRWMTGWIDGHRVKRKFN